MSEDITLEKLEALGELLDRTPHSVVSALYKLAEVNRDLRREVNRLSEESLACLSMRSRWARAWKSTAKHKKRVADANFHSAKSWKADHAELVRLVRGYLQARAVGSFSPGEADRWIDEMRAAVRGDTEGT